MTVAGPTQAVPGPAIPPHVSLVLAEGEEVPCCEEKSVVLDTQRATIDTDVISTPGGILPRPDGVGVCSNASEETEHPCADM